MSWITNFEPSSPTEKIMYFRNDLYCNAPKDLDPDPQSTTRPYYLANIAELVNRSIGYDEAEGYYPSVTVKV